mmetsp:Transcript_22699/g.33920  ORF Transcript_22699/g.33920 Transcript_22699/m.33920 type:complete len:450 (-) Transcript_22699:77-1426(-)
MKLSIVLLLLLQHTSSSFSMASPKRAKLTPKDDDGSPSTTSPSSSYLSEIPMGAPDAILGIAENFKSCTSPDKVNVCVGAYRDENGKPWILPSVREAEKKMIDDPSVNKEYASIAGDANFVSLAIKFAYGQDLDMDRVAAVQSLSGTGACRIGGAFLAKFAPTNKIYIPNPTWGNHLAIFQECGLEVERYRYYSRKTNGLDLSGMVEDIKNAPNGSIILLHACAHNPTGCDPTKEEWKMLSDLCKEKELIVFFDSAYQGFASGDAEADAFALRMFVDEGHNVMLAQSFAKNFGLYGERCGTLSFVTSNKDEKERVMSQVKRIIRPMYSSPPVHGSSIVRTVLSDEDLTKQYYEECEFMATRIGSMRKLLVQKLKEAGSTHNWSHITSQIGMFAYTGMSSDMCDRLTSEFFIFLTRDGRISLAGLNEKNVGYVATAIHAVTDGKEITSDE